MQSKIFFTVMFCHVTWVIGEQGEEQLNSEKQPSKYVRIGEDSFVNIGKDVGKPEGENLNKRYSSFVRIGKSQPSEKRYSSFVRIGKSQPTNKRYSSFVRIGKSPAASKRYSSFVRIGKSPQPDKRLSSFMRIGKANGLMKRLEEIIPEQSKRYSSFVRIGKDLADAQSKRGHTSAFVRIGKNYEEIENLPQNYESPQKRLSSFVRIGKNSGDLQKKYSSFVRIGKSASDANTPYTLIKSPEDVSDLQGIPEDQELDSMRPLSRRKRSITDLVQPEKRGFIRIGKIPSSAFMRIGRNALLDSLMLGNYVRKGRRAHSSFIRIGKRADEDEIVPIDENRLTEDDLRTLIDRNALILREFVE